MEELEELIAEQAKDMRFGSRVLPGRGQLSLDALKLKGYEVDERGTLLPPKSRSPASRTGRRGRPRTADPEKAKLARQAYDRQRYLRRIASDI